MTRREADLAARVERLERDLAQTRALMFLLARDLLDVVDPVDEAPKYKGPRVARVVARERVPMRKPMAPARLADVTAGLMGDPVPGRSALDQKRACHGG